MKKKNQNTASLTVEMEKEISQMVETMVENQLLKEENKVDFETCMKGLYLMAGAVFRMCPKMGEIILDGKMLKTTRKENENKTREFVVKKEDKESLELWCVRGVKDDAAFAKLWSKRQKSVTPVVNTHIGFLYVSMQSNRLFEVVSKDDGTQLLVAARDEKDCAKMLEDAAERGYVPSCDYDVFKMDTLDCICDYVTSRSMKSVSGGYFKVEKKGKGYYNRHFDVLQFDDFRDGKHKEFCCSIERLKKEKD